MKKTLLILILFLFTPKLIKAQGQQITAGPFPNSGLLYVCPVPSGGTPCPSPSSIFSNVGLTSALANPLFVPAQTTVTFYIASGQYTLEMPASGVQQVVNAGGGGIASVSCATNGSNCFDPTQAPYNIKFDAWRCYGTNVSWTNSSTTVTVDGTNCKFTPSMNGKSGFGTNGCCGGMLTSSTLQFPYGTVTYVSATQITMSSTSTAACNTTACAFAIGTDNPDANWLQLSNDFAATQNCPTVVWPIGFAFLGLPGVFNTVSLKCGQTNSQNDINMMEFGAAMLGQGEGVSGLIIIPRFTTALTANCTGTAFVSGGSHVCIGAGVTTAKNFTITGFGQNNTGNHTVCLFCPGFAANSLGGLSLTQYASNDSGTVNGTYFGFTNKNDLIYVDGFGNFPCFASGVDVVLENIYCLDSNKQVMTATGAGSFITFSKSYFGNTNSTVGIDCGFGTANVTCSFVDVFIYGNLAGNGARIFTDSTGGVINLDRYIDNGTHTFAIQFGNATTKIHIHNSTLSGTTRAIDDGGLTVTGFVDDQGGNTFTGGIGGTAAGVPLIADGHSVKGKCTGVATAASTLGLYGTGPNVTLTTCTSTTVGGGIVNTGSRTIQYLRATATAGGVNASSGVVTVLKNGGATTITCTLGTGTSCFDATHTVAVADGDLISIQFTTQAADTLAGVSAIAGWN